MTPLDLAKAYLAKGQEDEAVLGEFVDNPRISDSIFGFHAQQAIEKYLKAILALREESPARTHDLVVLANQCQASGHPLPEELSNISKLSPFAVQERYPLAMTPAIDRRGVLALVAEARRWTEETVE